MSLKTDSFLNNLNNFIYINYKNMLVRIIVIGATVMHNIFAYHSTSWSSKICTFNNDEAAISKEYLSIRGDTNKNWVFELLANIIQYSITTS